MSGRVSDPLAKYAKRIQSGRDAIAVKRPTAWDVAVVEFADALLDSRARVKELKFAIKRHREHIHSGSVTVHEADASLWAHETLRGEER
jgi:hypothetical protein